MEPHREDRGRLKKLRRLVALGEKGLGEIEGEGRIGEPVIPFDQVAGGAAQDSAEPTP
jgi:hypothetical protein